MPKNPLFYRDWDDTASEALLSLDDEVSEIITSISEFDLSEIESLRAHYEGNTPAEITKTITGIKSLATIGSPVVSKGDKYVFDYNSRYFTADIPFGLFVYNRNFS